MILPLGMRMVVLMAVLAALGACGMAQTPGDETFADAECWFDNAGANPAHCAWLRPGRQDSAQSTALPVVVLGVAPARASEYAVIYLSGGPGGDSRLDDAGLREWRYWHATLGLELDLVLYDPRGSGRARPGLPCAGYDLALRRELASSEDREARMDELDAAVLPCLLAVPEADRRSGLYSTATAAQDLRELMAALQRARGYRGFVLYGASYGTRLAIETMRDQQVPVERLVLDSVFPPGAGQAALAPGQLDALLDAFDAECLQLIDCEADEGGIRARLKVAMARFAAAPITVEVADPAVPSERIEVRINDEGVLGTVLYAMYYDEHLARLPDLLAQAAEGRFEDDWRALLAQALAVYLQPGVNPVSHTLIQCRDNEPPQREAMAAALERHPDFRALLEPTSSEYSLCERLGVAPEPLATDWRIERSTLVVNRALDPATPVDDARAAMDHLADGELIVVPGAGHGAAMADEDTIARVGAFLNGRAYEPPAESCPAPGTFDI